MYEIIDVLIKIIREGGSVKIKSLLNTILWWYSG